MSDASWQVVVRPDGQIEFVRGDDRDAAYASAGGTLSRRRASVVEPVGRLARALFRAIRGRSADDSAAAAFTRVWPVRWRVAIVNGPTFGPFWSRRAAIAAEVRWLEENRL